MDKLTHRRTALTTDEMAALLVGGNPKKVRVGQVYEKPEGGRIVISTVNEEGIFYRNFMVQGDWSGFEYGIFARRMIFLKFVGRDNGQTNSRAG